MLDEKQIEQLEKFKIFSGWMYNDPKVASDAQFLVALGLFNYIETLGAFRIGYFKKDGSGQILKCSCNKGCDGNRKTTSRERFDNFFAYLGPNYENLLRNHQEIYDELRCGLTHEFLPKNRKFSIAKIPKTVLTVTITKKHWGVVDSSGSPCVIPLQDAENITVGQVEPQIVKNYDGSPIDCGVMLFDKNNEEIWQIFVPNLRLDFEIAVKKLIEEIESERDQKLINNFFEAADNINLENFE